MIKSFKCADTEKIWKREFVKKFSGIELQARKRLKFLNATPDLKTLAGIPGNRFEILKGDRKGQYSIGGLLKNSRLKRFLVLNYNSRIVSNKAVIASD